MLSLPSFILLPLRFLLLLFSFLSSSHHHQPATLPSRSPCSHRRRRIPVPCPASSHFAVNCPPHALIARTHYVLTFRLGGPIEPLGGHTQHRCIAAMRLGQHHMTIAPLLFFCLLIVLWAPPVSSSRPLLLFLLHVLLLRVLSLHISSLFLFTISFSSTFLLFTMHPLYDLCSSNLSCASSLFISLFVPSSFSMESKLLGLHCFLHCLGSCASQLALNSVNLCDFLVFCTS